MKLNQGLQSAELTTNGASIFRIQSMFSASFNKMLLSQCTVFIYKVHRLDYSELLMALVRF